jgi:hypothetical protein
MLKVMDDLEVFERIPGGPVPFLLLDGHHSRLEVKFLDYIFDPADKGFVCIGVRYTTHYWQVADSSELNGTYKMVLTRAKEVHFLAKPPGHRGWSSTDIIPLVNFAYPLSFGIVERGKKAIQNCGWGPLNYALLQNADILSTKGRPAGESSESTDGGDSTTYASTVDVRTRSTALNTQKGYAADLLEGIVREAMKDDGRRDKISQKMQAEVAVADTAMQLKKMTKVTSGGLASCGMYHIDSEIHIEVRERKEQRMAGDAATLQKRTVREERIVLRAGGFT